MTTPSPNVLDHLICQATDAESIQWGEEMQSLWSGYGVIQRARLIGVQPSSVVVKHIDISSSRANRRGWGGDTSHLRKVRSYQVETAFYESYSRMCDAACRVPKLVAAQELEDEGGWIIVLEDLDSVGFNQRKSHVSSDDVLACLRWLAEFHATFINSDAKSLWPVGTYWHLATRPDELAAMPESSLKLAAERIDRHLNLATHQTLVHGDAKIANFCFGASASQTVAAVDFQYVGRGCGMKDVAYLISSCMDGEQAALQQDALLGFYFEALSESLIRRKSKVDFATLESEWRELYPFAWADFCRFLAGWSPGHWKLNQYNDRITQGVLRSLD